MELTRFSVTIPVDLLRELDEFVKGQKLPNRSEAVREIIRRQLVSAAWESQEGNIFGVLVMVYDHHSFDVLERLTEVQHDHVHLVVSTMHVHLDHHNCLELSVLKGPAFELKAFVDRIYALRGLKFREFVAARA